jgi:hypothetical protein
MRLYTLAAIAILLVQISANAQTLEQQEKCVAQAERYFQEANAEWDANSKRSEKLFEGMGARETNHIKNYQSHYNTKLQKCLVLLERDVYFFDAKLGTGFNAIMAFLSDAYERRGYASYVWQSNPGKKYWEVSPSGCELIPTLAEQRTCSSREEFDAFVSPYLQQ